MEDGKSMVAALEPYFDSPLADIPPAIRKRIVKALRVVWDALGVDQRRQAIASWDYINDPSTEADRKIVWEAEKRIREIDTLLAAHEPSKDLLKNREDRIELNTLTAERAALIADRSAPPPETNASLDANSEPGQYQSPTGIKKQQVITAFNGLHFNDEQWSNALADGGRAPWLLACRTQRGTKDRKHAALWDPVQVAIALADDSRKISLSKLDAVFVTNSFLEPWKNEWAEKSKWLR